MVTFWADNVLYNCWACEGGGYECRIESDSLSLYSSHGIREMIWLQLVALQFNSFVSFIFFSWQTKLITASNNFKALKNNSKWQKYLYIKYLLQNSIWLKEEQFRNFFSFVGISFSYTFLIQSVCRTVGYFVPTALFTGCQSDSFGDAGAELWHYSPREEKSGWYDSQLVPAIVQRRVVTFIWQNCAIRLSQGNMGIHGFSIILRLQKRL